MRTVHIIPLLLLVIYSCSQNPLEKPISEPLTIEEIRAQIEKDPSFASRHEFYESLRKAVFTSDTKVALYDATYLDGEQWFNDRSRIEIESNGVKMQAEEEWQNRYTKDKAALEELAEQKRKLLKEQGLDSYIDVKFKNIEPSKMSMDRWINFTITALKGCKIHNFTIHYVINKPGLSGYSAATKGAVIKGTYDAEYQDISTTELRGDWVCNQDFYYKTENMSAEEMTKRYIAYYYVTGIVVTTKTGKRLSESNLASSLDIPHSLNLYLKEPSDIWELLAIQECVDKSFTSKSSYVDNACETYLRARNPKFYKLLDEAGVKYQ